MADPRLFNFATPSTSKGQGDDGHGASSPSRPWQGSLASLADALAVYSEAVQDPAAECANLESIYCAAQEKDSPVLEARILREDFCSSALVAHHWLSLGPDYTSQGVDIDLAALQHNQKLFGVKDVRILQSSEYAKDKSGCAVELVPCDASSSAPQREPEQQGASWASGAATERFDRRLAKKLARSEKHTIKPKLPDAALETSTSTLRPASGSAGAVAGPRLTLLHADVLSLPLVLPSTLHLPAPDIVASLNYALCYFHTRTGLLGYLRQVVRTLRAGTGRFVCDQFAGPQGNEVYPEQAPLWEKFSTEPGFMRPGDPRPDPGNADVRVWKNTHESAGEDIGSEDTHPKSRVGSTSSSKDWPRGNLLLVRKGKWKAKKGDVTEEHEFEYWREDGPVDYMTNRFRMSLSFRFQDGSWLRDVFAYDFRVWSLCEVIEAMYEVGFSKVTAEVLPRGAADEHGHDDVETDSEPEEDDHQNESQDGLQDMAWLMKRTEREERSRSNYEVVQEGEMVFAQRSFASEWVHTAGRQVEATTGSRCLLSSKQHTWSDTHLKI